MGGHGTTRSQTDSRTYGLHACRQRGLSTNSDNKTDSTTSRENKRSYYEWFRRKDLTKNTHDCHDDKTITRRTRQAPIKTDTSFTSELSDSTVDSTYTTIASTGIPYGPTITKTTSLTYAGLTLSGGHAESDVPRARTHENTRSLTSTTRTQHA